MKRVKFLFISFSLILGLLLTRLFYIGVVKNKSYTSMVMSQRTESHEFKSPRGIIYDRNMLRLTNSKMELLINEGKAYYVGRRTGNILSHVIGYISLDGKGSGIEGAFDYVLAPREEGTISYLKDINNNRVSDGYAIDLKRDYSGISLTIDYHIQKITEEAMDKHKIKGAVIIVNPKTGEILSMASRPNYEAHRLADYLDGKEGELLNKGILQYNPGSVFKIVVAAAFLENFYTEEMTFECKGKTEIDGIEFVCHKEEGHGVQTFEEAFANSCNCAFYTIGGLVGIDNIYRCSTDFGIGSPVLNINGIYEYSGFVPKTAVTMADLANISIGQGDVMATPLQIADIVSTICNGGVKNQLTLIRGMADEKGNLTKTGHTVIGRVIGETTARRLMDIMTLAVKEGTGKNAQIKLGSAGKTGTAQTGWQIDGKLINQGWFAGFFPAENPQYVCVVIAEDGETGSDSACPVFKDIAESIKQGL